MRVLTVRFFLLVLLVAAVGHAQEQTGVLQGRVTDSSGGVLPGTAVTVAGPAILGGSVSTVVNESGMYLLRNIPVGVYNVSFEISGFGTKIYEGVSIRAGTTFTLNANLALASLQETVTVQGETPIIETAATNVGFTFTKELMTTVPNARDIWAMVAQAPGVTASSVNVGGTNTGNQLSFRGHGVDPNQNTYMLNGANVTDNTSNGASQFFFDVDSFEEMQIQVNSHSAEVQTPGMLLNIVPKSGTNNFHGNASLYANNDALSWNNVDDNLRTLGVDRASNLRKYFDSGFDLGGPIQRDKLWFYGAFRWQEVERFITGTVNPDGSFPIDRTYLWYPTVKINWQPVSGHNVSFYANWAQKKRFKRGLSATRPVETTWDQQGAPIARLFTFRDDWTIGSRTLVALKANVMDQGFELRAQQGIDVVNTPVRYDAATGMYADAPTYEYSIAKNLRNVAGTVSHYMDAWGGQHDLKFGVDVGSAQQFGNLAGAVAKTTYPADHRLVFFNGQPLEVYLYSSDASRVSNPTRSAFVQDSWKRERLTLNIGLRWDWQANRLDEVTTPESRFFEPVTQPATGNLIVWNTFAPRLGAVYDVLGDAKMLLKGSYSRYYNQLWTDRGARANAAADRTARYTWNDLNGDERLQYPEELGSLLSLTDPARNRVDIDSGLAAIVTDEFTAGIVRQVANTLSFEASYMNRRESNSDWLINRGIAVGDYTGVTGTDPGIDGVLGTADDGGSLTFYELDRSKTALSANYMGTRPGYRRSYNGFEVKGIRRMADNWQLVTSLTIGMDKEQFPTGSFINPQDIDKTDGRRLTTSVPWVVKVMGSYQLPYGFNVSGVYSGIAGNRYTRTVNSTSALGRRLNQGNVAIFAEPLSSQAYDPNHIVDLRLGYDIRIGDGKYKVALAMDVFNLLNINTITSIQTLSGPSYGRVLEFIPPRILRFGGKFTF